MIYGQWELLREVKNSWLLTPPTRAATVWSLRYHRSQHDACRY